MTIIAPVAIPPAGLPLPDPTDRATFSARKLEQLRWANNEYSTGSKALADASYANALDAQTSATSAAANAAATASDKVACATYAGAVAWVSGTVYAQYAVVYSPANGKIYRRITASGSGTTDPSLDSANWIAVATPATGATIYLNALYGAF
jgi:biotin carboxyl carrier protein